MTHPTSNECGWLIEWPADDNVPVRWWHPVNGWMRDASKGVRFSRKQDAEAYISAGKFCSPVVATEHAWGFAPETRKQPERPFGWYRLQAGKVIFQMGDWPPPEPDDVAWYPLYSSPEGRPVQETEPKLDPNRQLEADVEDRRSQKASTQPTVITCANMKVVKEGDKCDHCGNVWLVSLDGKGIWHNCHTGLPSTGLANGTISNNREGE